MSAKESLVHLRQLFTTPSASTSSAAQFDSFTLSPSTEAQLDQVRTQFSFSYGISQQDADRERSKWREGLLELWHSIEPAPGTEVSTSSIEHVSRFIELLDRLSAAVKQDDDGAIISRADVGQVWYPTLLKRVLLGTAYEVQVIDKGKKNSRTKPVFAKAPGATVRPLVVTTSALHATRGMVTWAMLPPTGDERARSDDYIAPFGVSILTEHNQRKDSLIRGLDQDYGLRNLEECILNWAEKSAKAFLIHSAKLLSIDQPSHFSALSLLLAFLTKQSARAYHALSTPLVPALIDLALITPASETLTLATRCLVVLVVTLPVVIGAPNVYGCMAVYGRAISWNATPHIGEVAVEAVPTAELPSTEISADALELFTVLYGIYPCSFISFINNADSFLRGKPYDGRLRGDDNDPDLAATIKDRSQALVRLHALSPHLIGGNIETELTDIARWGGLESSDVRAECDRNVIQVFEAWQIRGSVLTQEGEQIEHGGLPEGEGEARGRTSRLMAPVPSLKESSLTRAREVSLGGDETPDGQLPLRQGRSRLQSSTPPQSRSRSPTPHMPATTHYHNFNLLQSASTNSSPRRSQSRFRSPDSGMDPLARSGFLAREAATLSPNMSESLLFSGSTAADSRPTSIVTSPPGHAPALSAGKLETQLVLLQGEVNFQNYLKQHHIAHMGTLHREKVLESGAEAERQGLYRIIKILKAQLSHAQTDLNKQRTESGKTKENWTSHIDDLKEKLKALRGERVKWDHEKRALEARVAELGELEEKANKELETQGAELFDLKNQVSIDQAKMDKIAEYEARVEGLTKTVALCDDDLAHFAQQRKTMDAVADAWKKADLLIKAQDHEAAQLKATIRDHETELNVLRQAAERARASSPAAVTFASKRDDAAVLRKEVERLRARNLRLEEELADERGGV